MQSFLELLLFYSTTAISSKNWDFRAVHTKGIEKKEQTNQKNGKKRNHTKPNKKQIQQQQQPNYECVDANAIFATCLSYLNGRMCTNKMPHKLRNILQ